jgi:hypothetical protein
MNEKGQYGVVNNPAKFLKFESADEESRSNLKYIEAQMEEEFNSVKPVVMAKVREAASVDLEKLDAIRWQLLYLVREGLDLNQPEVAALYERMVHHDLISAEAYLAWALDIPAEDTQKTLAGDSATLEKDLINLNSEGKLRPAPSAIDPSVQLLQSFVSKSR